MGYLEYVIDADRPETVGPGETRVVCEYVDVFPDSLPGLPPRREIELAIDLILGSKIVSKAPYRMALAKLKELKVQLQGLLDMEFIRKEEGRFSADVD